MILQKLIRKKRFTYVNPVRNVNCGEFEVDNWVISDFVVNHLVPIVGYHPFPLSELMLMTAAVTHFKPTHIYEWGTNVGKSARIFYEISKLFSINAEIYSIDLPDDIKHVEHPKKSRGKYVKSISSVKLLQGDGLSLSLELYEQHKDKCKECKPLFFLDGDHSFESVNRELQTIDRQVEGKCILIHDTFYQDQGSNYNIGPFEAVSEILKKNPNKYKVTNVATGLPGMTLLSCNTRL